MHRRPSTGFDRGFNFVQIMLALLVISIGFLGLATLSLRTHEMRKKTQNLQNALSLGKKKMSDLSSLDYEDLATGTTASDKILYGAADEEVISYGPLNKEGLTSAQSSQGPFIYTLSFVVCLDDTDTGASAPSQGGAPCGNVKATRPPELACDVSRTDEGEVEIRVLVTYFDREGTCKKVDLSNLDVNMDV